VGPNLLGLSVLKLNRTTVLGNSDERPVDLLALSAELFSDDMVTMKDVNASIHVQKDVKTSTRSQSVNIIEPMPYPQWTAHTVSILTPHCASVAVNRHACMEQYPIPVPEYLFATLAGGVMFPRLHSHRQALLT